MTDRTTRAAKNMAAYFEAMKVEAIFETIVPAKPARKSRRKKN